MSVMYGRFDEPKEIKVVSEEGNFCRFDIEPFERGVGHTVGNALRRIMLTSLESPAIISVRIEGVLHEYSSIEGIMEDMTHIILNLKKSCLRYLPTDFFREPKVLTKTLEVTEDQIDQGKGSYKVTLQDIFPSSEFEVVNPDLVIFTATRAITKRIDLRVGVGRGYVPSESPKDFEPMLGEIIIDASFSPVRLVNYKVENARVGSLTEQDKLILEVTTDGRITPKEALSFASQILINHLQVFASLLSLTIKFDQGEIQANKEREELLKKLVLKISEIELSVRSSNCLNDANISTIGELVLTPESEMLEYRNFGKKSLAEIKRKLEEMGLSLGMNLSKYAITRENIQSIIEEFVKEKSESE